MRIALAAAAVVTLVASSTGARAQPADTQAPAADVKSEGTATAIAVGATVAGYALGYAAFANGRDLASLERVSASLIVLGPSLGHIYAGEHRHAIGMVALRAGGVFTFAYGLLAAISLGGAEAKCADCTGGEAPRADNHHVAGEVAMVAGAGMFIGGTIYDLVDAHRAARRTNDRARAAMFVPTVIQVPGGMAPGMALAGRF